MGRLPVRHDRHADKCYRSDDLVAVGCWRSTVHRCGNHERGYDHRRSEPDDRKHGTTFTSTAGTINVAAGIVLTISSGTTALASATVLSGPGTGTMDLAGTHTLELVSDLTLLPTGTQVTFSGNVTVNGPGTLINQTTLELTSDTINADVLNSGTIQVFSGNSINGALTTTSTSVIHLEGNGSYGTSQLTVANGFTNNGLIELTDMDAGYMALTCTSRPER